LPEPHLVRKLICACVALTGANTIDPPDIPVRTATGRFAGTAIPRPAPSISQNIPRIAHTAISTARITDPRNISVTAAPAMNASM
jgi:hypothetical protein